MSLLCTLGLVDLLTSPLPAIRHPSNSGFCQETCLCGWVRGRWVGGLGVGVGVRGGGVV